MATDPVAGLDRAAVRACLEESELSEAKLPGGIQKWRAFRGEAQEHAGAGLTAGRFADRQDLLYLQGPQGSSLAAAVHGMALVQYGRRDPGENIQQESFAMLARRAVTWTHRFMKCMGRRKKEQTSPTITGGAITCCRTLAETGDVLYVGLREGYRHTSYGSEEVLPGMIPGEGTLSGSTNVL